MTNLADNLTRTAVASFNLPDQKRKPESIGSAVRSVEMKVVDDDDDDADVAKGEVSAPEGGSK